MQDFTSYAKQPLDFEVLPAGGYIARIIDVDDRAWDRHIEPAHLMHMDIADGEHTGLYMRNNQNSDKERWLTYWFAEPTDKSPDWLLSKVGGIQTSLKESNEAVDLSNPHKWKGKLIGVVVGDEEAESSSGTIYTRPYVSYVCSADRIKEGNFKVPKLKKLESAPKPLASTELPDSFSAAEDDIPFK